MKQNLFCELTSVTEFSVVQKQKSVSLLDQIWVHMWAYNADWSLVASFYFIYLASVAAKFEYDLDLVAFEIEILLLYDCNILCLNPFHKTTKIFGRIS